MAVTPLSEELMAEAWITGLLLADATLTALAPGGVWSDEAPQGSVYPLLVLANVSGVDTNPLGTKRALTTLLFDVTAWINTASRLALDAIMQRVDLQLQGGTAAQTYGLILGCRRVAQFARGESVAGIRYRRLISTYQVFVSRIPT